MKNVLVPLHPIALVTSPTSIVWASACDAAYLRTSCTFTLVRGSASRINLQICVPSLLLVKSFASLLTGWNNTFDFLFVELSRYSLRDETGHSLLNVPLGMIKVLIVRGSQQMVEASFFARKQGWGLSRRKELYVK